MPIEIRSAQDAFATLTKVSRYPSPARGKERLLPYPDVDHQPAFKISRNDKIFTIGSCFARNIERALSQLGLNLLSSIVDGHQGGDNIANKYTSRSILNDLRMVLSDTEPSPEDFKRTIYLNEKGEGRNLAFGGGGSAKLQPLADLIDSSRSFYQTLSKITEADLVIITLGLIETWYDTNTSTYLNIPPSIGEIKAEPDRFALHVLSYDDIREDLTEIFTLINSRCKPGVRILCTVSPVPLAMTFRQQDCLQANSYSKAVQRAAVEEVLTQFDNAFYFPSFEMVALAAADIAWTATDYRHVQPSLVDRIMRKVIFSYIDPDDQLPSKEEMSTLLKAHKYSAIIKTVERVAKQDIATIENFPAFMRYYYAAACLNSGRVDTGVHFMQQVVAEMPRHTIARDMLAKFAPDNGAR